MNTARIKAYAPKARRDFIKAVTERANFYGIFGDKNMEPVEFKGDIAIISGRAFSKKEGELREKLLSRIKRNGFEQVMRASAYTWFNRFVALRYMELHGYLEHGYRILSNPGRSEIPEILEHAADVNFPGLDKDKVIELRLAGNKDNELYRLLVVAQCNALHRAMPFLFEEIDSEAELLLPDNLLHTDSPIRKMVIEIDEEDWNDVEIIGWIYQFYISERKDEVIGKVVKSEDIPAATQLFTPNWIVKYMVQNTLGRMWLATYPDSPLKEKMEYYIEPAEQKPEVQAQLDAITPKELNPEEITFLDPACGSGHILVEAYDVLKEIYLERGYRTKDIPRLTLEKNLYGLDIDDRAAQLACFAVLMRARRDDRRVLSRNGLELNVMAIQDTKGIDKGRIAEIVSRRSGKKWVEKWDNELIDLFEEGKTFGSLITVPDGLMEILADLEKVVEDEVVGGEALLDYLDKMQLAAIKPVVRQARILATKYDCVVTNPPYMGIKGMNQRLKAFLQDKYTDVKSDLFSAFILRNIELALPKGKLGFMSPFVWMFISSYEKLRSFLIDKKTITSLIQLEYSGFEGATVPICTFTIGNANQPDLRGGYVRLFDFRGAENQGPKTLEAIKNPNCGWFYSASAANFKKIPGSPIAYWLNDLEYQAFKTSKLDEKIDVCIGMKTGDNEKFVRYWHEVSNSKIGYYLNSIEAANASSFSWFPYLKGGAYRKWHGNYELILNWIDSGENIKCHSNKNGISDARLRPSNYEFYFQNGINWSFITSGIFGIRIHDSGFFFDVAGSSLFAKDELTLNNLAGYLNSKLVRRLLGALNPTLNMQIKDIKSLPWPKNENIDITSKCTFALKNISKNDWDSYETSWDFIRLPILQSNNRQPSLEATYTQLRNNWSEITLEVKHLEEQNNRFFIEAYGLQDELVPEVPLSEITLTCNPHYRYGGNKSADELEALLLADTIKELISYAIGCMMGRYSLDHPGLIYANSGNIDFDPSKYETFPADDDGIIPVMDQDWFKDDAANRFVEFIKKAWPPETLDENLKFVADSLKPKNNEAPFDAIRRYMSTGFFKDHLKTYKKRPIYWLFSSGKQKAFECLVYLHRYNESTLSRIRSNYVTPLQGNFSARLEFMQNEKDAAATASAQRKVQKEIDALRKKQVELSDFDDELRHYADMKISLDLDDGVKANYGRFGNLLAEKKAVAGKT